MFEREALVKLYSVCDSIEPLQCDDSQGKHRQLAGQHTQEPCDAAACTELPPDSVLLELAWGEHTERRCYMPQCHIFGPGHNDLFGPTDSKKTPIAENICTMVFALSYMEKSFCYVVSRVFLFVFMWRSVMCYFLCIY